MEAKNGSDVIELLQNMVRIPSINGHEDKIGEYLYNLFVSYGWDSTIYEVEPERPAVVAVIKGKRPGKRLMLTTHYDTHVVDNMDIEPFNPVIKDGIMYGRGSCDAKGSIAAMITAAHRIYSDGCDFSGEIVLAFVPDEEYLNKGTTYLINNGITADMAVVGEPTEMVVGFGHRGCTHLDIEVEGKAYHSAFPERGINAIEKMAGVITALRNDFFPSYAKKKHPYLGSPVINLGLIRGGTRIHTVADYCCASFLRRDLPGETTEGILGEIQRYLDKLMESDSQLKASVKLSTIQQRIRLPFFMDPDHPLVEAMMESYSKVCGKDAQRGVMNYYCDASILCTEAGIPTIIFGPGSISVAHSSCEYIPVSELVDAVDIYKDFALSVLNNTDGIK